MFWKYNLITASHIETLLDKENVSLRELMDEEDILQECKAQTKKLLDFLVRPDIMDEMITLITKEPDNELDERQRYKYSNIACELLTFDIDQINDALVSDEGLLSKLYNFLSSDQKLNPLLASFFSKTMGLLISKKTDTLLNFLKGRDFITLLLNHMETSAIMDLLLRFITSIENQEMKMAVINWLNEHQLIERLIKLVDTSYSEDCNCYASQALCDIIRVCREHMSLQQEKADPNPLLEVIESTAAISNLLTHMFRDVTKESALINGVLVLLALLEFKKQGPAGIQQIPSNQSQPSYQEVAPQTFISPFFRNSCPEQMTALDAERLTHGVNNVLVAITLRLEDFHELILNPPAKPAMKLTFGQLEPPFGYCRLEVAHLLTALISTNNHIVNAKLASLGTVVVLLDMFFKYSWNNFLHTQVEQTIGRIITNDPTVDEEENKVHPLLDQILGQYKLTVKIVECFEKDHEKNGYEGHLTKIANHIAQNVESGVNSALIRDKIKETSEEHSQNWEEFVNNKLAEINRRNTTHLGGGPPGADDNPGAFRDIPIPPIRQAFSDYQMQEMTSNFVDQFGFNDDEFGESDENLSVQLKRLSHVNFHLASGDNVRNSELFEQICCEKLSSHDDTDSDEDVWEDKGDHAATTFGTCFVQNRSREANSSDSDEEAQVFEAESTSVVASTDEIKMDVDHQEGWTANFESVPMELAPTALNNPWESAVTMSSSSDEQGNWADFSNFASFGSSNAELSDVAGSTVSVAMETSEITSCNLKCTPNCNDATVSSEDITVSEMKIACTGSEIFKEDSVTSDKSKLLLKGADMADLTKNFEETQSDTEGCIRQKDMTALFDEESCSASINKSPCE